MVYSDLSDEELVKACAEGDAEAWQEFVRRFHRLIGVVVLRVARRYGAANGSLADDLIQITYLKICANNYRALRDFRPRHPGAFPGMLRVVAANVTHDHFRGIPAPIRRPGMTEVELSEVEEFIPDTRAFGPKQIQWEVLLGQIDRFLAGISSPTAARDREIFWLHYGQGFTADAIAKIGSFKLTVKGVESILYRLIRLLRRFLAEPTGAKDSESPDGEGIDGLDPLGEGEEQS